MYTKRVGRNGKDEFEIVKRMSDKLEGRKHRMQKFVSTIIPS